MADKVISYIAKQLIDDSVIGPATEGRVFPGHISNVPQPSYPCITLERILPGYYESFTDLGYLEVVITAFSETSYDECSDLLDAIKSNIGYTPASEGGSSWVICPYTTAIQGTDRVEKLVYYLRVVYKVYFVN
jgi:hypothetical protein